jgi:Calcineurin-like phosphoesterase
LSHLYLAAEAVAPPNYPPESFFAPAALWAFLRNYLAYVLRKKHDFPPHTASPQGAIYDLLDEKGADTVKIALVGDWGTGTEEAERVAEQMKKFNPHFTIHIGDVYYIGDPPEINENCLGVRNPNNNYDPVTWPIGTRGSFALNGNHEMYANGGGYFDVLLPKLGLCVAGKMTGQQTSFFCLQNRYWRIIAIDTGYNSNGVPILGQIPIVNKIPGLGGDCKLRTELIDWLTAVVLQQPDNRGVIIMSHHQYYSGFEDQYRKPAQQLWAAGIKRPGLWFWGHEHRLAGYDLYGGDQLQAFGRCIGHGGMPLSLGAPTRKPGPKFYDNRQGVAGYGVNGHVNLSFAGPNLTATYVDLDGTEILREAWSVDASGVVQFVSRTKLISDPDFHA